MNNKYENRLKKRRMKNRKGTIEERHHKSLIEVFHSMTPQLIEGFSCVPKTEMTEILMDKINVSKSTAERIFSSNSGYFDKHKIGKRVYLSYRDVPDCDVVIEREVTKSSAITTVATILADIANVQDTLFVMTEFYETLDVEYEQVKQLNEMVRNAAFELANQADALGFTISEE